MDICERIYQMSSWFIEGIMYFHSMYICKFFLKRLLHFNIMLNSFPKYWDVYLYNLLLCSVAGWKWHGLCNWETEDGLSTSYCFKSISQWRRHHRGQWEQSTGSISTDTNTPAGSLPTYGGECPGAVWCWGNSTKWWQHW